MEVSPNMLNKPFRLGEDGNSLGMAGNLAKDTPSTRTQERFSGYWVARLLRSSVSSAVVSRTRSASTRMISTVISG